MEQLTEITRFINGLIPIWLPATLFVFSSVFLYWKSRLVSALIMSVGFLIALVGAFGMRFPVWEDRSGPDYFESKFSPLSDFMMTVMMPGWLIGGIGFVWFVYETKKKLEK